MDIEKRLKELNVVIPDSSKALAAYVPGIKAGEFIFVSGQLPIREGKLLYGGRVGRELSLEEGQAAARLAVINCLAVVKTLISNDWDSLLQIVRISGFIQSDEGFFEQAQVMNGASELLKEIFAERGIHSRIAMGVNCLPLNAACEIEMIARIK